MKNHVLSDLISDKKISEITRADIIDFRSRIIEKKGDSTANKAIGILKTIFKEALFREEIDKDPTTGIGKIKHTPEEVGIFTMEELNVLFPKDSTGPWIDLRDYACFLIAATLGMRKSEILALKWKLTLSRG